MAVDLLAAPASQAFLERLFSVSGMLSHGRRNRMEKSLEMRVMFCMRLNKGRQLTLTERNDLEMELLIVDDSCVN